MFRTKSLDSYPSVVGFDLDQTLLDAIMKEGQKSKLSDSVSEYVSNPEKDPIGFVRDHKIIDSTTAHSIAAIARKEMKNVYFDPAFALIKKAKKYGVKCPLKTVIITASLYEEEIIKKLFDQFYGDNDGRFSSGLFPIEFYNKNSFETKLAIETIEKHELENILKHGEDGARLKKYEVDYEGKSAVIYDPSKTIIMAKKFQTWKNEVSLVNGNQLKKENTFFYDDSNCINIPIANEKAKLAA